MLKLMWNFILGSVIWKPDDAESSNKGRNLHFFPTFYRLHQTDASSSPAGSHPPFEVLYFFFSPETSRSSTFSKAINICCLWGGERNDIESKTVGLPTRKQRREASICSLQPAHSQLLFVYSRASCLRLLPPWSQTCAQMEKKLLVCETLRGRSPPRLRSDRESGSDLHRFGRFESRKREKQTFLTEAQPALGCSYRSL